MGTEGLWREKSSTVQIGMMGGGYDGGVLMECLFMLPYLSEQACHVSKPARKGRYRSSKFRSRELQDKRQV